jgi:hypothetical protein
VIRCAELSDTARIVTLLKHSREAAGFDQASGPTGFSFPFDPAYAQRLMQVHMMPRHLCLVLDVDGVAEGVLMAAWAEHPFGPVRLARETVWWIEPGHRGVAAVKMLDGYEKWAVDNGCQFVGMAGMGEDPAVGTLYQRRGYRAAEIHFLKSVS